MMKRSWLGPLGSILFGLLLLLAVEGLLRLAWEPALSPAEQLAAVVIDPFAVNNGLAQTKPAYLGAMRSSSFAVPKREGVYRVFCLGGSTTLGYPYTAEFAWPASLERRLNTLFPERQIEVINVGGTSYGSARTLAVLRGLLAYQPDLLIVATGDAGFVEDSFRIAVSTPVPAVSWLHGLYLSRTLKQILPKPKDVVTKVDAEDRSAAGFLFSPVVAGTVYQVDAERRSHVMAALRKNLLVMTEVAEQAAVPLMLMTLPANVASWPPDPDRALPPSSGLRGVWQDYVDEAKAFTRTGDVEAALEQYKAATKLWNGNASVCFDYGRLLMAAGEIELGQSMLLRAVDLDPAPVRATAVVNQIIRTVAEQAEVIFADPAKTFAALSPHGLTDDRLILDYAHPTPRGHLEIAQVVLQALLTKTLNRKPAAAEVLAVHQAELERITEKIPVVNAGLSFVLGQVFERKGLMEQAIGMYRQAVAQGYQGPFPSYNMARLLASQGRTTEALELVTNLVTQYPDWEEPYGLLGYLHQRLGDKQAAASWYRRALDAGNSDSGLYASLAELQNVIGQYSAARRTLEEGLQKHPGDCDLAVMLGRILELKTVLNAGAEEYYRKRLHDDPACQLLWENFGLLLMRQRRWREAEAVFTEALRQPQPLAQHYLNLGYVYLKGLENNSAAGEQFARFLELQPERASLVPDSFRETGVSGGKL